MAKKKQNYSSDHVDEMVERLRESYENADHAEDEDTDINADDEAFAKMLVEMFGKQTKDKPSATKKSSDVYSAEDFMPDDDEEEDEPDPKYIEDEPEEEIEEEIEEEFEEEFEEVEEEVEENLDQEFDEEYTQEDPQDIVQQIRNRRKRRSQSSSSKKIPFQQPNPNPSPSPSPSRSPRTSCPGLRMTRWMKRMRERLPNMKHWWRKMSWST